MLWPHVLPAKYLLWLTGAELVVDPPRCIPLGHLLEAMHVCLLLSVALLKDAIMAAGPAGCQATICGR
jgi:hypothetical protein